MDKRIGRSFLNAGLGYGGSCFPKDIAAFIAISEQLGIPFDLLKEVQKINKNQLDRFVDRIRESLWVLEEKKIAVWGLSFKPDTDDIRCSVAIELIEKLVAEGAEVSAFDPKGMERVRETELGERIQLKESPEAAAAGAEALVIATEWPEFANVDFAKVRESMTSPLLFDGRNLLDPGKMKAHGFEYHGIGRGTSS